MIITPPIIVSKLGCSLITNHTQKGPKTVSSKKNKLTSEAVIYLGANVIKTKGAIHYLSEKEIEENRDYLNSYIKKDDRKIWCLIMGGPTKYYDYSTKNMKHIFSIFYKLLKKHEFQKQSVKFCPRLGFGKVGQSREKSGKVGKNPEKSGKIGNRLITK